jgi:hypothetical protein
MLELLISIMHFVKKNAINQIKNQNVLFMPSLILGYLYTTFLLPQQIVSQKVCKV